MELKLNGSQINLATRYKPNVPAVRYPQTLQRPWSASVTTTSNNSCIKPSFHRRPVSADSRVYPNNLKNSLRFSSSTDDVSGKFNQKIKKSGSSTNILHLMLSEPIKRSWGTPDSSKFNRLNLNRKSKLKRNISDESDQSSEVEEDIQEFLSNEEDEPTMWRTQNSSDRSTSSKHLKPFKPSLSSSRTTKTATPDQSKKYVTFSNNTEIVPDLRCLSSTATSERSDATFSAKPDLPGRVSFSKNDVYEIDFSDYENDTDTGRSVDQPVDFQASEDTNLLSQSADREINDSKSNQFCCELKCNSMACTTEVTKDSYDPKNYQEIEESNKIIEDYKKSIKDINRQYQFDTNQRSVNLFSDIPSKLPFGNISDDLKTYQSKKPTNVLPIKDSNNELDDGEALTHKSIESEADPKLTDDIWFNIPLSLNRSNEQQLPLSDQCSNTENLNSSNRNANNEIIGNYLKETNQKIKVKSQKKSANNNSVQTPTSVRKLKSVCRNPIGSKALIKPLKGNSRREDSNIGEFQIDKVESWMSLHEKDFGKAANHKLDRYNSFIEDKDGSSIDWSLKTPRKSIDGDDNFFIDESIENGSLEESPYDEIVSIIKEIDDQKQLDLNEISTDATSQIIQAKPLTSTNTSNIVSLKENTNDESADKMKEILSYLDGVDSSCAKTFSESYSLKMPNSFRSDLEFSIEPDIVGDVPKVSDLIMMPNQQLARRIVALSLRANELSNAVQLSKEHMAKVRQDKLKAIRCEKQNCQSRITEQKNHFENVVVRHQGFIEQLLKDKAELCEKVSALTRRIESQNQAWEHKLQTETLRVKETTLAGEKIRRERWVKENTKKIKELTVKGLEQEINKMTSNHQKEINELKRNHQQELLNAIADERQKHEMVEMGIRESYSQDREVAIEKERNAIRERFDRQMENEQKLFEEQKNRLLIDFVNEKERLYAELKEKEHDFERRKDEIMVEKNSTIEQLKMEFCERIKAIDRKNQAELTSIREQYESDFTIWKREHETAYKLREVEIENAVRQQCRIDRDKQIDIIIAKVDAETLKNQQEFDSKINRLKDKFENEIRDTERSERNARDLYNETRSKLAECEANKQNIQSTVKQLEMQLIHAQKMCNDFINEKELMKEAARNEIQLEVSALKKERDNEIERIYARVQQAIEKKDATVDFLQKDNTALKERCIKLEAIVRQQRKDYCTK